MSTEATGNRTVKKWIIALLACGVAIVLFFTMVVVAAVTMIAGATSNTANALCLPGSGGSPSGSWMNPLKGPITSPFGPRKDPTGTAGDFHNGFDIAPPEGTPYYSASAGTVVVSYGPNSSDGPGDGGNGIIIDAGNGVQIWYWHAQQGSSKVKSGDKVQVGQQLATVGATGNVTGPHLHMEVHVNGQPVDPEAFMRSRGVDLGTGASGGGSETGRDSAPVSNPSAPTFPISMTQSTGMSVQIDESQYQIAKTIYQVGQQAGVNSKGITVAYMVALQESGLKMYANSKVPESLNYPYTAIGSDNDSVNPFQQRPGANWGTVAQLMNLDYAAAAFFGGPTGPNKGSPRGLLDIPGWQQMNSGSLAQAVQVSAFPDAYNKWEPVAVKLYELISGNTSSDCKPAEAWPAGSAPMINGPSSDVRTKIIEYAKEGLGGTYVWGGNSFKAWDCSGYVQWVMTQAGIKGIPRTEQWTIARSTSSPQPGDLVVQNPTGPNTWGHVGIYAGDGKMYSALNAAAGTLLHPVDWNPGTQYFTFLDG